VAVEVALVRFHGENAAVNSYADAKARAAGDARWTQEVGFVQRGHGDGLSLRGMFAGHFVDVDESDHVSQKGAAEGAVAAGLVGVLAGPPGIAVGVVVGGLIGAGIGRADETEAEPRELAERVRAAVPPSSSAIVLIAGSQDVDEMLAALGDSAGDVVRRALSSDEEAALQASIATSGPTAP
jgi:uncharacterized membrane protein